MTKETMTMSQQEVKRLQVIQRTTKSAGSMPPRRGSWGVSVRHVIRGTCRFARPLPPKRPTAKGHFSFGSTHSAETNY